MEDIEPLLDVLVVVTPSPVRDQVSDALMDNEAFAGSNNPIHCSSGNGTSIVTSTVAEVASLKEEKDAIVLFVPATREDTSCCAVFLKKTSTSFPAAFRGARAR